MFDTLMPNDKIIELNWHEARRINQSNENDNCRLRLQLQAENLLTDANLYYLY